MTQRQFEFFKALYEEENSRLKDLIERGKIYLSVVAAYSGLFAFTTDKLPAPTTSWLAKCVFCLVAVSLIAALVSIMRSLGIYSYEGLVDPEELLKEIGANAQSDDVFFDFRVADLSVAHNRNEKQNDRRAWYLSVASWLTVAGILFHMVFVFLVVFH